MTASYEGAAGVLLGAADHGGPGGHLPATQSNVELVSNSGLVRVRRKLVDRDVAGARGVGRGEGRPQRG